MAILGGAILLLALLELASILFVPCLLGLFYLKYKLSHPTGEQWEQYFKTISNCGYLVRFYAICLVPLLAVSALGYFLFGLFGFQHPALLGALTFALGVVRITLKLKRHKQELLEKLCQLRRMEVKNKGGRWTVPLWTCGKVTGWLLSSRPFQQIFCGQLVKKME